MSQLTELEKKLKQDQSGSYRDTLLVKLRKSKDTIFSDLALITCPLLRENTYHVLNSHTQAEEIIQIIWKRYHSEVLNVY